MKRLIIDLEITIALPAPQPLPAFHDLLAAEKAGA
jgi:hypothetical protein